MKTTWLRTGAASMTLAGLMFATGCVVYTRPVPPPPGPEVAVDVPDNYVWDGNEYVGVVGDNYFYLGPGNVWLAMEPWRFDRFHAWIGVHPDWRGHYIHNDRYRRGRGRDGRVYERRGEEHREEHR